MLMRFYFDLVNRGTTLLDEVGIEAADPDEALEQAKAALEELCDSGETAEWDNGWHLRIRDETSTVLRMLPV